MSDKALAMETDLVDLDELVLADLKEFDDSALTYALRRVLADADGLGDPIAAFQSSI